MVSASIHKGVCGAHVCMMRTTLLSGLAMCTTPIHQAAVVLLRPGEDHTLAHGLQHALGTMPLVHIHGDDGRAAAQVDSISGVRAIFELGVCSRSSIPLLELSEALGASLYRYQPSVAMFKRLHGTDGPTWIAIGTASAASEEIIADANGWGYLAGDEEPVLDTKALTDAELRRLMTLPAERGSDEQTIADAMSTPIVIGELGYQVMSSVEFQQHGRHTSWTAIAARVLLLGSTEPPHSYTLADGTPFPAEGSDGVFVSAATGAPLFDSVQRRRSTSGWPSFVATGGTLSKHLKSSMDYSAGTARVELVESHTGLHLGHDLGGVYCINAAALAFVPRGEPMPVWLPEPPAPALAALLRTHRGTRWLGRATVATLAAGCFWHFRRSLAAIPGVLVAVAGYCGGESESPTYEDVCTGRSGHVEAVQVAFDPLVLTFTELLESYWGIVPDPTSSYRQGMDIGPQYESAIFFHSDEQRQLALLSRERAGRRIDAKIVTKLRPAGHFWMAGVEHQR